MVITCGPVSTRYRIMASSNKPFIIRGRFPFVSLEQQSIQFHYYTMGSDVLVLLSLYICGKDPNKQIWSDISRYSVCVDLFISIQLTARPFSSRTPYNNRPLPLLYRGRDWAGSSATRRMVNQSRIQFLSTGSCFRKFPSEFSSAKLDIRPLPFTCVKV